MSDNKKPDRSHSGSNGEDDGNRCHLRDQHSPEEILRCLQWLIIVAAAGFLALQLITNAIHEEQQFERDVAWISRQSRQMYPIDEEDEDMEDEDEDELQNQMEEAEDDEADDEMCMEEDARASCFLGVSDYLLRKNEDRCSMLNFLPDSIPNVLMSVPFKSEEPAECKCEKAAEETAKEEEEEEDETGELDGESKKNLDSAGG
ncbi:hypothetical protein A6R68_17475 [Neotoma lepida]|uniref:Uncharacterized protein n=1 Tax=Neotoma lepida TaxID=56216 RepID=A0A1A6HCR8_NEOLE|nr:hypothetical protein A6R68_17475 [Neotoma lepida]